MLCTLNDSKTYSKVDSSWRLLIGSSTITSKHTLHPHYTIDSRTPTLYIHVAMDKVNCEVVIHIGKFNKITQACTFNPSVLNNGVN